MSAFISRRGALGALCTVTVTAAALALAGCGPTTSSDSKDAGKDKSNDKKVTAQKSPEPFADLSGPDIVNKAMVATRGVTSLDIKADMQDATDGHMVFDLALNTHGNCTGSFQMLGGSATMTKVGKTLYMKFDEKLLRAQAKGASKADQDATVAMMAGRWVKTNASTSDFKDFSDLCDLDSLLKQFSGDDTVARKKGPSTVAGQPAFTLTEKDGKSSYAVDVATEGKPYLLRMVSTGADTGTVSLSDFDKPVKATAPADKDVVDLDKLPG